MSSGTPIEKTEMAYETMQRMQELNRKIYEIGVRVHKEHNK